MREYFRDPTTCPVGNICQFNGAPEIACGSVPEHVPQLAFAEDLCFYGLVSHLDSLEAPVFYKEQLQVVSAIIEIGLNTSDDNLAKACFSGAKERLTPMLAESWVGSSRWLTTAKDLVYLPALEARRFNTFNQETMQDTYGDLGALVGVILKCMATTEATQTNLRGALAEVMVEGLLMRLQESAYFPYGATNHENRGLYKDPKYNHDASLRRPYGKLPIQIKYRQINKTRYIGNEEREPEYDPSILQISYHSVVGATIQKFQECLLLREDAHVNRDLAEVLLAHTLILEASGEELDESQLVLLRCASSVVVQKILDHERELKPN